MGGVKIIPMLLMPFSNGVSWYFILNSISNFNSLRLIVCKISLFYTLWALYNKYLGGKPQELGHVSFGLLALICSPYLDDFFYSSQSKIKIPFFISCGLVVLNFAVVVPLIISMKGPTQFASKVMKEKDRNNISTLTRVWGYVFTTYIVSNIILWSFVLYQFYILFDDDIGLSASSADNIESASASSSNYVDDVVEVDGGRNEEL
jgi:hypothetical protein